ncbi:hypothetical protein MNBD_BACTEROID04-1048, partial [hydrothermal vent metagenome]
VIPDDVNDLVENLNTYRKLLKGNLLTKIQKMNKLTKILLIK